MNRDDLEVIFTHPGAEGGKGGELAIDRDGRLYWNGKPVLVERAITLTTWQKFGAAVVVTAAGLGGLLALLEIVWWFRML